MNFPGWRDYFLHVSLPRHDLRLLVYLLFFTGTTFRVAFPRETWRTVEPNCSVLSVSAASLVSGLTFTKTQHCGDTGGTGS